MPNYCALSNHFAQLGAFTKTSQTVHRALKGLHLKKTNGRQSKWTATEPKNRLGWRALSTSGPLAVGWVKLQVPGKSTRGYLSSNEKVA